MKLPSFGKGSCLRAYLHPEITILYHHKKKFECYKRAAISRLTRHLLNCIAFLMSLSWFGQPMQALKKCTATRKMIVSTARVKKEPLFLCGKKVSKFPVTFTQMFLQIISASEFLRTVWTWEGDTGVLVDMIL